MNLVTLLTVNICLVVSVESSILVPASMASNRNVSVHLAKRIADRKRALSSKTTYKSKLRFTSKSINNSEGAIFKEKKYDEKKYKQFYQQLSVKSKLHSNKTEPTKVHAEEQEYTLDDLGNLFRNKSASHAVSRLHQTSLQPGVNDNSTITFTPLGIVFNNTMQYRQSRGFDLGSAEYDRVFTRNTRLDRLLKTGYPVLRPVGRSARRGITVRPDIVPVNDPGQMSATENDQESSDQGPHPQPMHPKYESLRLNDGVSEFAKVELESTDYYDKLFEKPRDKNKYMNKEDKESENEESLDDEANDNRYTRQVEVTRFPWLERVSSEYADDKLNYRRTPNVTSLIDYEPRFSTFKYRYLNSKPELIHDRKHTFTGSQMSRDYHDYGLDPIASASDHGIEHELLSLRGHRLTDDRQHKLGEYQDIVSAPSSLDTSRHTFSGRRLGSRQDLDMPRKHMQYPRTYDRAIERRMSHELSRPVLDVRPDRMLDRRILQVPNGILDNSRDSDKYFSRKVINAEIDSGNPRDFYTESHDSKSHIHDESIDNRYGSANDNTRRILEPEYNRGNFDGQAYRNYYNFPHKYDKDVDKRNVYPSLNDVYSEMVSQREHSLDPYEASSKQQFIGSINRGPAEPGQYELEDHPSDVSAEYIYSSTHSRPSIRKLDEVVLNNIRPSYHSTSSISSNRRGNEANTYSIDNGEYSARDFTDTAFIESPNENESRFNTESLEQLYHRSTLPQRHSPIQANLMHQERNSQYSSREPIKQSFYPPSYKLRRNGFSTRREHIHVPLSEPDISSAILNDIRLHKSIRQSPFALDEHTGELEVNPRVSSRTHRKHYPGYSSSVVGRNGQIGVSYRQRAGTLSLPHSSAKEFQQRGITSGRRFIRERHGHDPLGHDLDAGSSHDADTRTFRLTIPRSTTNEHVRQQHTYRRTL